MLAHRRQLRWSGQGERAASGIKVVVDRARVYTDLRTLVVVSANYSALRYHVGCIMVGRAKGIECGCGDDVKGDALRRKPPLIRPQALRG